MPSHERTIELWIETPQALLEQASTDDFPEEIEVEVELITSTGYEGDLSEPWGSREVEDIEIKAIYFNEEDIYGKMTYTEQANLNAALERSL